MLGELGDRHTCPDLRRGERVPKIVRNQLWTPALFLGVYQVRRRQFWYL